MLLGKARKTYNTMGKFGNMLAEQAAGSTGGLIGGAMGLILGGINDRRQIRQQQKLQDMQIKGNKELADYNYGKQLEMWNATGYKAQKEQLKAAGLNPGLLYGMGGSGGATTGGGGATVNGAGAPSGGGEVYGLMQQGMQMQLMKAQKENIEADTANKQADTSKKGADTKLTGVQTDYATLQKEILGETRDVVIDKIQNEAVKLDAEAEIMKNERKISDATIETEISTKKAQLAQIYAETELKRTMKDKSEAEIKQMAKELALKYQQLANEQDKTKIQSGLAEFEQSFGKQVGSILGSVLGFLPRIGGKGGNNHSYRMRD